MAQCLRRRKKCLLYISLLIVSVVAILVFTKMGDGDLSLNLSEGCEAGLPSLFVSQLCRNYTHQIAYGNLCQPLCRTKDVIKTGCVHHGDTVVIYARWRGKNIVLKWKRPHEQQRLSFAHFKDLFFASKDSKSNMRGVWKQLLLSEIESVLGPSIYKISQNGTDLVLRRMGASFTTDPRELHSFLPLIGQDEFATLGFFQDLKHFPRIYGYCGQAYGVEKLEPYSNVRTLDWKKRVKLALSFLDLIVELEHTQIGPLHHCDIQEGNFGITNDFEVKVIDVDLIFTDVRMKEILVQPNCSKDADCDFFDCVSMCDVKRHKCLARKTTNNFQVLCRDIFKSSWPGSGLFGRIPSKISPILSTLLNDCSSKRFGYLPARHHRIQSTLRTLKLLLSKELKMGQKKQRIRETRNN